MMKLAICKYGGRINIINVASEHEAVNIQQKFIDDNNLGASSFGFAFIIKDERLFKVISYNGRIWTPEETAKYVAPTSWSGKQMIKFGYKY